MFLSPLLYSQSRRNDRVFHLLGLCTLCLGVWGLMGFLVLFTFDRGAFEGTPLYLYSRIQLGNGEGEERVYDSGEFWVSVGVLAVLNLVGKCAAIVASRKKGSCYRSVRRLSPHTQLN